MFFVQDIDILLIECSSKKIFKTVSFSRYMSYPKNNGNKTFTVSSSYNCKKKNEQWSYFLVNFNMYDCSHMQLTLHSEYLYIFSATVYSL